jgi:hypothetical protein
LRKRSGIRVAAAAAGRIAAEADYDTAICIVSRLVVIIFALRGPARPLGERGQKTSHDIEYSYGA